MNFEINYPESPLFVIAKAVDEGLTRLAARERSGQMGAEYIVNPKEVQFACLTWFGFQVATRTQIDEVFEALETAFAFVLDPKKMADLREFLEVLNKKLPGADVPAVSAQLADAFAVSENAAVLILAIRFSILRRKG